MQRSIRAALLLGALGACASNDGEVAVVADSVPAAIDSLRELPLVASVGGFSAPESAIHDPVRDVWFVTNINGSPVAKDNNGFISRMLPDGTVDSLRFIAGGRAGVTLHAPKGTALVGDTLWVADIDAVRGFHAGTGAPLVVVEFGARAAFLNDLARGPDGALYVTDTGLRFGNDRAQAGTGEVFRIAADRSVTTVVRADTLRAPNGITWDPTGNRFVVVSFESPTLFTWEPGAAEPQAFATAGGDNDGVEVVNGVLLLTSWSDSSLTEVDAGASRRLVGGLSGPADFGVDPGRNRVAVPLLTADRVQLYELPRR